MGTFRDYICNECASAEGEMPRPIVGPLRGTATQRKNYATHLGSRPAKATNGVFNAPYHSTTAQRVIFDEAVANGAIEVESGDRNSTNLVMAIPSGVAQMESKAAAVGPATAFRVVNSSLSHAPHGYPGAARPRCLP
jgi:hypothetical protein